MLHNWNLTTVHILCPTVPSLLTSPIYTHSVAEKNAHTPTQGRK